MGLIFTIEFSDYQGKCGSLHMDEKEPIYNSSVLIQDVALKTYQEWWMIEMGGERGSGRSVLVAHDDDVLLENVM